MFTEGRDHQNKLTATLRCSADELYLNNGQTKDCPEAFALHCFWLIISPYFLIRICNSTLKPGDNCLTIS